MPYLDKSHLTEHFFSYVCTRLRYQCERPRRPSPPEHILRLGILGGPRKSRTAHYFNNLTSLARHPSSGICKTSFIWKNSCKVPSLLYAGLHVLQRVHEYVLVVFMCSIKCPPTHPKTITTTKMMKKK